MGSHGPRGACGYPGGASNGCWCVGVWNTVRGPGGKRETRSGQLRDGRWALARNQATWGDSSGRALGRPACGRRPNCRGQVNSYEPWAWEVHTWAFPSGDRQETVLRRAWSACINSHDASASRLCDTGWPLSPVPGRQPLNTKTFLSERTVFLIRRGPLRPHLSLC